MSRFRLTLIVAVSCLFAPDGKPASVNRCACSYESNCNVRAIASSTCGDALIWRACSSHVYQVTPTPASCATSSRRRPGVRRRRDGGRPTSSGLRRSRRLLRKAASSRRRCSLVPFV